MRTNGRKTQSGEQRAEFLERLTKEIRRAYRRTWDDDDAEFYSREISLMVDEFGLSRTENAVMRAIRTNTFKPTIAELRSLVPAAQQTCWKPTAEEIRQAEEARNSPEAKEFRALLSKICNRGLVPACSK